MVRTMFLLGWTHYNTCTLVDEGPADASQTLILQHGEGSPSRNHELASKLVCMAMMVLANSNNVAKWAFGASIGGAGSGCWWITEASTMHGSGGLRSGDIEWALVEHIVRKWSVVECGFAMSIGGAWHYHNQSWRLHITFHVGHFTYQILMEV